jgi:hypothetical protein
MFVGEDLVHRTSVTTTTTHRTTTDNNMQLVQMARRDFLGTNTDTLSAENEGRMGTAQHTGQM